MKRILITVATLTVLLFCVIAVNTIRYAPSDVSRVDLPLIKVDVNRISQNLSAAIRFKTISNQDRALRDDRAFRNFNEWLVATYPKAHQVMSKEMINEFTPLFRWQGSDATLKPVLLTAHYDVVPVTSGTEGQWQQQPYAGSISEGFVWGRGALDDKASVVALLESVELLATRGFQPKQTVYFSFGHDEEIGGQLGAGGVVQHLTEQGVSFDWSLDEGSMVLKDVVPGLALPIASINVAEKGYMTIELTAMAEGGHSSMPPKETAVGILASAIDRLQKSPIDGGLTGVSASFFDSIAPNFPIVQRALFANRWLFGSIIESQLAQAPSTDAMLRTSIAPTMLSGSDKENILPIEATATVNFRLHPRDSDESVLEHVRSVIADTRIKINVLNSYSASKVSDHQSVGFRQLATSFRQVFGELIVAPGLTVAGTDTTHYGAISDNSYRISPLVFTSEDIPRIHGTNERVSVENLEKAVQFYIVLLEQLGKDS